MSNYTNENLINVPSSSVPAGTLAIKVGDNVFTAGNVTISGATDFYLCASVSVPVTYYAVSGAGTVAVNGTFIYAGTTWKNSPVYSNTASSTTYYMVHDAEYDVWFILDYIPGESDNPLPSCLYYKEYFSEQWYIQEGADPAPTVTDYSRSKTWTGYKAIQDQVTGAWGYASTVTSNLTYSEVTPVIGKVYADGALIEANLWSGIPTSGLVFYASLAASSATAETGQTLTEVDGSPTYATVQGIPCAYFDGSYYVRFSDTGFPYPNGFSVSLWVKGNVQDQQRCCVSWGTNEANESFGIMLNPNGTMKTIGAKNANNEWTSDQGAISTSDWNHICVVNRGTSEDIYVNGTKIGTFNWTRAVVLGSYGYIGAMTDLDWLLTGYLAGVRIYSRQLTDSEIAALAAGSRRHKYNNAALPS